MIVAGFQTGERPNVLSAGGSSLRPRVECVYLGRDVLAAEIVQSPPAPESGGQAPGVSVLPLGKTLTPVQLYDLAADLGSYSDRLRDLADQLTRILGGEQ